MTATLGFNDVPANPLIDSLVTLGKWEGSVTYYVDQWGANFFGTGFLNEEINKIDYALSLFSNVCGISFDKMTFGEFVSSPNPNLLFTSVDMMDPGLLGSFEFPIGAWQTSWGYGTSVGEFNWNTPLWQPQYLEQGGYTFITLIHEIGHALGLAHPHDDGGDSAIMPGVDGPFGDLGDYNLNQGINTTMTYNDGYQTLYPGHSDYEYGWQGTPMALDIAALQFIYGANNTYQTGDNTYNLPTANISGTFWSCIWDAGGEDTISNDGSNANCEINLKYATLVGENAGGYVSLVDGVVGGYTIANGVIIENAIGGGGNDSLFGNEEINRLEGRIGNDFLNGLAGADTMVGGTGDDTYVVDNASDITTELDGEGTDLVQSSVTYTLASYFENLTLTGSSAINATGNTLNNVLTGNAAANTLNGGFGADRMVGGTGDDTYVVDSVSDITTELASQGTDLVQASVSYTLASNLENLTLTGSSAINATGNTLNNVLTGNAAKNTLNGGLGADTLYGGLGQDLLYGGSDTVRDVFDFNAIAESKVGSARDKIYNFVTGKDDIDLSGIDANNRSGGDQAFKFGGTTKVANGVWYEKSGADLLVHADINGDKVSDMDIQLVGVSKLVATDFVL